MDDVLDLEYNNYWETKMFYEELDSWGLDEALSAGYYDSSSPEVPTSSSSLPATANNIAMERNRRRKLNESLYALRSVVPTITKMDKASILKDAIDYVQALQEEERRMTAELEAAMKEEKSPVSEITTEDDGPVLINKRGKKRSRTSSNHPIEVTELNVAEVGDNTMVICITCSKRADTVMKLCGIFESLNLKILSANITSVCGSLLHTVFVEGDGVSSVELKRKIEAAIAECDAITSPTSSLVKVEGEDICRI